jgi:hypothetical protein
MVTAMALLEQQNSLCDDIGDGKKLNAAVSAAHNCVTLSRLY